MVEVFSRIERIFEAFRLDAHIPGLAWGVVDRSGLRQSGVHGVQSLDSGQPVATDTLFRIASMTKAFTALTVLHLRDQGRLRLDDLAEAHVPELRDWQYPGADAPRIRVRDLLNHCAGLVTDDPWGDRQNPLPEDDFSALLAAGVPFSRTPGTAFEYSNLGYALLGRIIARCSGRPFAETIAATLLQPLGMHDSGFEVAAAPPGRRALGYRWEDQGWRAEPDLAHGTFGAMGGLQTSVQDYARWIAFLLAAWPPGAAGGTGGTGPVQRATVREMAQGSNFPRLRPRPGRRPGPAPAQAVAYGMGLEVACDPRLGMTLGHSGGYPGYGSYMLLLPERGLGLFAFANRTYARPLAPVWDAMIALAEHHALPAPAAPAADLALAQAYALVQEFWRQGRVDLAPEALAMNFLLDRDAAGWARDLAALQAELGALVEAGPIQPSGALSGDFLWTCRHGRLQGSVLLAPTRPPAIQALSLAAVPPYP